MKRLTAFQSFDSEGFFHGKTLIFQGGEPLIDFESKIQIGIKCKVLIREDESTYGIDKEGKEIKGINQMESVDIKILDIFDVPTFTPMSQVKLISPIAKIYGEFNNQLSVTCEKIILVDRKDK